MEARFWCRGSEPVYMGSVTNLGTSFDRGGGGVFRYWVVHLSMKLAEFFFFFF